jgi:hypothetical protein
MRPISATGLQGDIAWQLRRGTEGLQDKIDFEVSTLLSAIVNLVSAKGTVKLGKTTCQDQVAAGLVAKLVAPWVTPATNPTDFRVVSKMASSDGWPVWEMWLVYNLWLKYVGCREALGQTGYHPIHVPEMTSSIFQVPRTTHQNPQKNHEF